MADVKGLLSDPEFNQLGIADQKSALGRIDPDFSKLSDDEFATVKQKLSGPKDPQTGVALPGVPTPKAPAALQPASTASAWEDPSQGLIAKGTRQLAEGFESMSRPGRDAKFSGAANMLKGTATAMSPMAMGAMVPAAIAAPAATASGVVAGTAGTVLGGLAGRYGAQALDAGPGAQDLSETVGGIAGGAGGGYLGSKLPSLFRTDPHVAINRSLRPVPSNSDFNERIPDTLAAVKAMNPGFKPAVENGQLNVAPAINKTIGAYQDALEPWMQRMEGTKVSGSPIVAATKQAVQGMLPTEQGTSGQALIARAQQDYGGEFSPRDLRERLALLNQRAASLYSQAPNRQSAALADIPEAVLKAQRDAAADTLYRHLDPENAGAGPREIQSRTGDLIDLRDAALRRQNAIVAEQPLTTAGAIWDKAKGIVQDLSPWGGKAGTGIAYSEGSQGRSLPLLRRAFNAVDEAAGANAYGTIPRPGPRMLPAPPDTSGPLPPGVGGFRSVGQQPPGPKLLGPSTTGIGVSGKTMPEGVNRPARGFGGPQTLLPAPSPGQPPVNVLPNGPGSIGPGGTVPKFSAIDATRLPATTGGQVHQSIGSMTQAPLTMDDVAAFAQKNMIPFTDAAVALRQMGFQIGSGLPSPITIPKFARGGIIGLPPRIGAHY